MNKRKLKYTVACVKYDDKLTDLPEVIAHTCFSIVIALVIKGG